MSRNPIYIRLINARKWKDLRRRKLNACPLCQRCAEEGRSRLATEVHHVVPVESVSTERDMKRLMYDVKNLRSLCHECHVTIHQEAFSHSKEAVKANNKRSTDRFLDEFLK